MSVNASGCHIKNVLFYLNVISFKCKGAYRMMFKAAVLNWMFQTQMALIIFETSYFRNLATSLCFFRHVQ